VEMFNEYSAYRHVCGGKSPEEIHEFIEKQIPKKVIHDKGQNVYNCPTCKEYIKEDEYFGYPIGEDENYCKICGQKLDWNK